LKNIAIKKAIVKMALWLDFLFKGKNVGGGKKEYNSYDTNDNFLNHM
jgi:hypothetical protein